jgi:hypothetical protein
MKWNAIMPVSDNEILLAIQSTVLEMHGKIERLVALFETTRKDVNDLDLTVNGRPGDDPPTGLTQVVPSLVRSRDSLRLALRGAWALLLVILGAWLRQVFCG